MNIEKCRLCLVEDNLMPLFKNSEQIENYSNTLFLATGLKIEANDGLPQKICIICQNAVNSAIQLRNRSRLSEKQLLNEINNQNNTKTEEIDKQIKSMGNKNTEFEEYCEDIHGLENNDSSDENSAETKWPQEISVKKNSWKEKRQMYLDLVEGTFDPKGPVKCKVCKNTLSKWACFLSHARLHLGFNFMCEFCGKSFRTVTQLNRHCRSHHGMKRDIKCQHCSYLALDNAQLKLHERRVHTGERPYVCDICASSYHSRRCLVQHIESHRTVATVKCDSCPLVFKSRRALARHRYSARGHRQKDIAVGNIDDLSGKNSSC